MGSFPSRALNIFHGASVFGEVSVIKQGTKTRSEVPERVLMLSHFQDNHNLKVVKSIQCSSSSHFHVQVDRSQRPRPLSCSDEGAGSWKYLRDGYLKFRSVTCLFGEHSLVP